MPNKLGKVTDFGCFKNDERMGNAKFCHNCGLQGGNEVRWTFEVLDDNNDALVGHVIAGLKCDSTQGKRDESGQKSAIIAIAQSLI